MKRYICILVSLIMLLSLTSCEERTVISKDDIDEVSTYVLNNVENLSTEKELGFFVYKKTTLVNQDIDIYYGYYYTENNEIKLPDFYDGYLNENYLDYGDEGFAFGEPESGADWCYVQKITDNWYYYELHWA